MKRRIPAVLAALGLLALAGAAAVLLRPSDPPRDIVLVVWDTCRADRLSAYGHPVATTPWLREFARDAVLYTEAYTPAPWTPPAHASLFTGLLPERHGLHHGRGDRVDPRVPLLAETLRDAGYETVAITCNSFVSRVTGLDRGFDRLIQAWSEEDGLGKSTQVLESLRAWIRDRRPPAAGRPRRPLFLFLNLMDAHLPWVPSPEDLRAVLGGDEVPAGVRKALALKETDAICHILGLRPVDADAIEGSRIAYDASVRHQDRVTGEIALRLRAAGILDGAFTAIVADHGEHLGEHGRLSHQMSLHREVLHVPMVVRWPGRLDGGRVERAQVRLQDLYPTILEAARVPIPPGNGLDAAPLHGAELGGRVHRASFARPLPFLEDARLGYADADAAKFREFQVSLYSVQDPLDAPNPRKLILRKRAVDGRRTVPDGELLFDPVADPGESRNLLASPSPEDRAAAERLRALR